jgi:heme-binding protein
MNEKGTLNKSLRVRLLAGLGAVGFASLLVHPFGDLKTHGAVNPLLAGADVDPAITQIIERSCQNCHSDKTEWPWYSYVAPVSWLIEKDVHDARSHMNLSLWGDYSLEKKQELLTKMAAAVRSRQMPPARYNLAHPSSKPSATDLEQIYEWARGERRRLRSNTRGPSCRFGGY